MRKYYVRDRDEGRVLTRVLLRTNMMLPVRGYSPIDKSLELVVVFLALPEGE